MFKRIIFVITIVFTCFLANNLIAEEFKTDLDNLIMPSGINEMISTFSELKYVFKVNQKGSESEQKVEVYFKNLGQEKIGGETTTQVLIEYMDNKMTGWVTDKGDVKKAVINSEEVSGDQVQFLVSSLLAAVYMPFNMAEKMNVVNILKSDKVKIESYEKSEFVLEGKKVSVDTYKVIYKDEREHKFVIGIADLGQAKIISNMESNEGKFELVKAVLK